MTKYYCDKCGKEIGGIEDDFKVHITLPTICSSNDIERFWASRYLLCRDCAAKIKEFIEQGTTD